jgi:hypothetical protein
VDLLLGELESDLPRAAAALLHQLNFDDLGKVAAIIDALRALKAALPAK